MNFTVWSNGLAITTSVQGIVSHAGSAWAASDSADTSAGCQICGVQYIPDMPITTYFSRPRARPGRARMSQPVAGRLLA